MSRDIALIIYLINIAICFIVGISYIFKKQVTRYHKEAMGVSWDSLAPGVKTLMLVLMKGVGGALFISAVSMTFILVIPYQSGEYWANWALICIGLSVWIPMLAGSIYVFKKTGASSPWRLNICITLSIIIGFFLSIK